MAESALAVSLAAFVTELLRERPDMPSHELLARIRKAGHAGGSSSVLAAARACRRGRAAPDANTTTTALEAEASDRRRDLFTNDAKARCRDGNLRAVVEQAPELWADPARTTLRGAWCELMGESGVLTLEMLEQAGVLAPGGFIGVDRDADRIERFRRSRPDVRWIGADLLDSVGELEDVAILNFDSYEMVGSPRTHAIARQIAPIIRRGLRRFNAFVLFWNADLDATARRGLDARSEFRRHADAVCRLVGDAMGPRRRLTADMLLPRHAGEGAARVTGQVGAFEIYRGRAGGHRMANLRLVLR